MKVLLTATVQSHICQFHKPLVEVLHKHGCEVHVAARDNLAEKNGLKLDFVEKVYDIPFARSPKSKDNIQAYKELKHIINNENYDVIHCNTPMGGIVTRLAAKQVRKQGTKVYYTAHGFHFYKGGALKNWLLFYPIEKFFSVITDVLITINKEDYELARKKFKAKKIYKIPGIGLDMSKFQIPKFDREAYRRKLGLSDKNFMILSVGELNENKNHKLVIQAISKMKDESVHYYIAGVGKNKDEYEELIRKLKIDNQVHLLGYRTDIAELNYCADVFAFPSIREGLGMAALEALACGTPVCGMDTRGIKEYVVNGQTGYIFENNVEDCINSLEQIIRMDKWQIEQMKENCKKTCNLN